MAQLHAGPLKLGQAGEGGALVDHGAQRNQSMPAQLRLGLGQHLGLQGFAVRCAVADDEGHQALRAAELSTVEDELRRRIGRGAQRQPGRAGGNVWEASKVCA